MNHTMSKLYKNYSLGAILGYLYLFNLIFLCVIFINLIFILHDLSCLKLNLNLFLQYHFFKCYMITLSLSL